MADNAAINLPITNCSFVKEEIEAGGFSYAGKTLLSKLCLTVLCDLRHTYSYLFLPVNGSSNSNSICSAI